MRATRLHLWYAWPFVVTASTWRLRRGACGATSATRASVNFRGAGGGGRTWSLLLAQSQQICWKHLLVGACVITTLDSSRLRVHLHYFMWVAQRATRT
jgi:hypothetical protein